MRVKRIKILRPDFRSWLIFFVIGIVTLYTLYRLDGRGERFIEQAILHPKPYQIVVLIILICSALWLLPKDQVLGSPGLTQNNHFERENEARKTLATILGGIFLLANIYSASKTFEQAQRSQDLARQGQITERYAKAIEQLGAVDLQGKPKLEVRLGGIYALRRIIGESPEDELSIDNVFAAYLRTYAPRTTMERDKQGYVIDDGPPLDNDPSTREDITAAIQSLATPNHLERKMNLSNIELHKVDLVGDYRKTSFDGSYILGGSFSGDFGAAGFDRVTALYTTISDADFSHSESSIFICVYCKFRKTSFECANLRGATIIATASEVDLRNTDLDDADLSRLVGLTPAQISGAILNDRTLLPLKWKEEVHSASRAERDKACTAEASLRPTTPKG